MENKLKSPPPHPPPHPPPVPSAHNRKELPLQRPLPTRKTPALPHPRPGRLPPSSQLASIPPFRSGHPLPVRRPPPTRPPLPPLPTKKKPQIDTTKTQNASSNDDEIDPKRNGKEEKNLLDPEVQSEPSLVEKTPVEDKPKPEENITEQVVTQDEKKEIENQTEISEADEWRKKYEEQLQKNAEQEAKLREKMSQFENLRRHVSSLEAEVVQFKGVSVSEPTTNEDPPTPQLSPTLSPVKTAEERRQSNFQRALDELISTECDYVADLQLIHEVSFHFHSIRSLSFP